MRSSRALQPCPAAPVRRGWLALVCTLMLLATTATVKAAGPSGPDDMPDVGAGAIEDHTIPRTPSDFIYHEVGWILFVYPRDARSRVEPLIESANELRRTLGDELGQAVLAHLEVRVAADPEQMAAFAPAGLQPPSHASGAAYARYRLILLSLISPNRASPRDLEEVYRHEVAHVALFDAVGGNEVPTWFNEGYAIHTSGERSWARARTLWGASLSDHLLPLSLLDGPPAHGDEAALATAQSADFARFLTRRQDHDRFKQFIGRLERGKDFQQALEVSYASSLRDLEQEWRDDLDDRYSYVPLYLGVGSSCLFLFAVVGVGLVRRRNRRRQSKNPQRAIPPERRRDDRREPPVRVTLTPRPTENLDLAGLRREKARDVPKVEHAGKWHTLH